MLLSNIIKSFACPGFAFVISFFGLSSENLYANGSIVFGFDRQGITMTGGNVPLDLAYQGSVGLAGLQFTMVCTSDVVRFKNVECGENINDASAWGFDFSVNRGGDTLRAVVWARNGRSLPEGIYRGLFNINVVVQSNGACALVLAEVRSVIADGQGNTANIVIGSPSSVNLTIEEKVKSQISQNFPNPCNPSTLVRYVVPEQGHVTLRVYNVLGQEVREVINGVLPAGQFESVFSMDGLPSGIYFYRFSGDGFENVRKMMFLK